MELAGDYFKPYVGLVRQFTTSTLTVTGVFPPIGRLIPWRMSKATLDITVAEVDTDSNSIPGFSSAIYAKRKATGTIHHACFDNSFGINGVHPNSGVAPFQVREGMYIRAAFDASDVVAGPHPLAFETLGLPIVGAAGEPPVAPFIVANSYIFLALLITKIHHEADAAAGQPFDFDFRSVHAFAVPGESRAQLTAYGYSEVVGAGGFL